MEVQGANIRTPGVAGTFYPSDRSALTDTIEKFCRDEQPETDGGRMPDVITGGIVPHAGINYCGRQAVHFFEYVRRWSGTFDTVILIHPNHYGTGPPLSADDHDYWEVPTGKIRVDLELAEELQLPFSPATQGREHSAEVIVPYILHFLPAEVRLVSLNMLDQGYEAAVQVARRIERATELTGRKVLLIASSDFSHFLPRPVAMAKDEIVLKEIISRNTQGVYRAVTDHDITVCGYGPIMALMEYSSMIDPEYGVDILSRGDSGIPACSGDVVSYVSALFYSNRHG